MPAQWRVPEETPPSLPGPARAWVFYIFSHTFKYYCTLLSAMTKNRKKSYSQNSPFLTGTISLVLGLVVAAVYGSIADMVFGPGLPRQILWLLVTVSPFLALGFILTKTFPSQKWYELFPVAVPTFLFFLLIAVGDSTFQEFIPRGVWIFGPLYGYWIGVRLQMTLLKK